MDYYRTLGIRRDATADEIKAAFRTLALKFHPDRHATSDPATKDRVGARFKEVSEAYQILSNDAKRAVYNREGRAGFRYGGASGYQQYSRHRGGSQSQYNRYQYDQSFHAREMSPEEAAARLRFYFKLARLQTFITLLGLGAFLFIDQAGESFWKRHNAGKSFEELQAAREARLHFAEESADRAEPEPARPPARPPPHLLVRRPNPGWPFHHRRQRDAIPESRKPKTTEGASNGTEGGEAEGRKRGSEQTLGGGYSKTESGGRLGDASTDSARLNGASSPVGNVGAERRTQGADHTLGVNKNAVGRPVERQGSASTLPSRETAVGVEELQGAR